MKPMNDRLNPGAGARRADGGTLPPAMAALLGRLPALPGSVLAAAALNRVIVARLPADVRAALRNRALRLRVRDAGIAVDFTWRGDRFVALAPGAQPDLEIAASARDFLALARGEEDPDTLFFSRRLAMEGDTELGLLVKNTLDAIEVPLPELARQAMPAWMRAPLDRLAGLAPAAAAAAGPAAAAPSRGAAHLEPRE